MTKATESIPGYSYGSPEVARSPVSIQDLERMKASAGFGEKMSAACAWRAPCSQTRPPKSLTTGAAASSLEFPA